jgi:hypothetical protein
MLPLDLRQEFRSAHMRGTAIELRNKQNTGWAQRNPVELLRMTYPTADVQRALEAVSQASAGRPILLKGQRGRGKSHIMALLHHAFKSPEVVEQWAAEWAPRLQAQGLDAKRLAALKLQRGFLPLTETLSDQEYQNLWDVIFELHPKGPYYRGKFEQAGVAVPAKSLIRDLFAEQPTALILDEFQTWFDGLHDEPGDQGHKRRQWAFNFVQTLSELAVERPDLLVLIVSVRESSTDAYQQIWRVGPLLVDFKGDTAKSDRKRLVLHRLFENRDNFASSDIEKVVAPYASERVRLLYPEKIDADKMRLQREVVECWPFAPELLDLIDDQILMAAAAQDTRDLIRILAEVFRARGSKTPLVTVADFHVDDDTCGVTSLLDSFATTADQERLRETAQRNLEAIRQTGLDAPDARSVISAIWMRSLATTNAPGGTRAELQLDIVKASPIDDNAFTAELATILENSFNIHEVGTQEKKLCFKLEENARSKLKASARNDKLFEPQTAVPAGLLAVRKDQDFLLKTLAHLLRSPDSVSEPPSRPIVLDPNWERAPWANCLQQDQPQHWDRPVLLVVPTSYSNAKISQILGPWLAANVTFNRNVVRFLLQKPDLPRLFDDKDLLITARCALLAKEWKESESKYNDLFKQFDRELRKDLASRFDRYAILSQWNFQAPTTCVFHIEMHGATGSGIPAAVEKHIKDNHFAPEDFKEFIVGCAKRNETMKQVLLLLRDPSVDKDAIPYLGDSANYEQILRVAAQDRVALNVNGTWYRREAGQTEEDALRFFKQRAFRTGKELHDVQLGDPSKVGSTGLTVTVPTNPSLFPTVIPPVTVGDGTAPPVVIGDGDSTSTTVILTPGTDDTDTPAIPVIRRSLGAKSGVNLLGELEKWAFADAQKVTQASLTLTGISIKDLRDLCIKLPPKLLAELQIILPPEGGKPS